jgi:transposase-like protein
VETHPELAADYELNIQEYAVARLAKEYGVEGSLRDWARLCARCRNSFAEDHHAKLAHELERLHHAIAEDSRKAQAVVREVARAEYLVHNVELWLQGVVFSLNERRDEPSGFIYAISNGETIKIGWSARHPGGARGRLAELQIASHIELKLLGVIEGTRSEEQFLHARFSEERVRGEWFKATPQILQHFGAFPEA